MCAPVLLQRSGSAQPTEFGSVELSEIVSAPVQGVCDISWAEGNVDTSDKLLHSVKNDFF